MVYNGSKSFGDIELKPDDLMEELASSGKKYTEEDVILVTHNSDGDLLWQEKGNPNNGWEHILEKHGGDFEKRNIDTDDLPTLMKEFVNSEPIEQCTNKNGPYAIYRYNGQKYRIGWGDNGYIKSFYPYGNQ